MTVSNYATNEQKIEYAIITMVHIAEHIEDDKRRIEENMKEIDLMKTIAKVLMMMLFIAYLLIAYIYVLGWTM